MSGKCHKTVDTGMWHAWHWSSWPDILSKVMSGSLLFSPVRGESKHSPAPDKHLLFPIVQDKAAHKAVDFSPPLQVATGFISHLQAVLLLLRRCGSCATIRRSEWCCVQGSGASRFRDNLPWSSSSLNDSHTNMCHHHYKNGFDHRPYLSEISDLNLRER